MKAILLYLFDYLSGRKWKTINDDLGWPRPQIGSQSDELYRCKHGYSFVDKDGNERLLTGPQYFYLMYFRVNGELPHFSTIDKTVVTAPRGQKILS